MCKRAVVGGNGTCVGELAEVGFLFFFLFKLSSIYLYIGIVHIYIPHFCCLIFTNR